MALNSANKIAWTYTDDDGTDWAVTAEKAITDQKDDAVIIVGGAPAVAGLNPWPSSWRKRKVYFTHGDKRKAVTAYEVTALAWTDATQELTLNEGSDVATYTGSKGHLGERKRNATASTS
jgi:hypothetical protein